MLPLLLAAIAANAPAEPSASAAAKQPAQAIVRIVRGAEFRFQRTAALPEESVVRTANVRERDGAMHSASLVEFY